MNRADDRYTKFHLAGEMMETPDIIRNTSIDSIKEFAGFVRHERILLSGEGSSRIFPAGKVRCDAMRNHYNADIQVEGATQAAEYHLEDYTVFVASNSGKTREAVELIEKLKRENHRAICGIVSKEGSPVQELSDTCYLLRAGAEKAVAATKTVVEQALFYDLLFRLKFGSELPDLQYLGDLFEEALTKELPDEMIDALCSADTLYWSGRSDGVAGELALKTNEITRKPALFLEGTYAVHGIEEVMTANQSVLIVNPFAGETNKFHSVLREGVGIGVFAIDSRDSIFSTVKITEYGQFTPYIELAAGWNILVDVGIRLGIDLDNPLRARKVGNEFMGTV